jgi:hypothetical protein
MTPSGTIVVLLLFFIFLVFPCFILLFVLVICAFFHGFTKLVVITTRTSHQQLESNLFIALNTEE